MAVLETVLTIAGGALSVTVGVVVGAVLTRRAQGQHWLRDRQLAAYQELMNQYATFAIVLRRAHSDRAGWDYDWAAWSAALTSASLVAPVAVAKEIDAFGQAVGAFLATAAEDVDTTVDALTADEFAQAMVAPAKAQLSMVNAMRRSLDKDQEALPTILGGSLGTPAPASVSDP
ncbi:MAG TPA: hypothetical protein VH520_00830 [Streptosporangiaceae bacterium]